MGEAAIWDMVTFNSGGFPSWGCELPNAPDEVVSRTPGLLQADAVFAKRYGGEFVAAAVEWVEANIRPSYPLIVDTKVHMLKPGWLPGIPGWHLDFAPNWTGVVDFEKVDPLEQHWMAITDGCSATEFLTRPLSLPVPRVHRVNGVLSRLVEAYGNVVGRQEVEAGYLYPFGQLDLHRARPATVPGWRLFLRISATRLRPALNEVRKHDSQVYILDENGGW